MCWKNSVCIGVKNFANLYFLADFTKKISFSKFAFNFLCEKANFSLISRTHITIHSF